MTRRSHRHAHKHDEHDLDEYEEETLQTQIRSGELGEMLQEAHLDHRIQMNFNDKAVAEEEEEGDPRTKTKNLLLPKARQPAMARPAAP